MKKRLIYIFMTLISFILCVLIVKLFSNNSFVRGFTGDVAVIVLIYSFIKIFYSVRPLKLAIFTLLFSSSIEFLQLFKLISVLGLENNTAAQLIIGSVFDPYDLAAYAMGAITAYFIDTRLCEKYNSEL